jgi:hypothetical protein
MPKEMTSRRKGTYTLRKKEAGGVGQFMGQFQENRLFLALDWPFWGQDLSG